MNSDDKLIQSAPNPKQESDLKPGESLALVKGEHGKSWQMARSSNGRFTRSLKRKAEKSTKLHQRILSKKITLDDGSLVTLEEAVLQKLLDNILASNPDHLSGSGKTLQGILDRAYGKIPTAAPENPNTPINIVVVPSYNLMHPTPVEEKPRPALTPSFVDDKGVINGEYVESSK